MDGLHELAASEIGVTIGGRPFQLARLRLADFARVERHLLARRPDPLAAVMPRLDGLAEPLGRRLLELAYDDLRRGPRVARDDLLDWLDSAEGQIHALWLSLAHSDPELTLEEVGRLAAQTTPEEDVQLRRALVEIQGNPRGN